MHIERSTTIGASPQAVWELLIDPSRAGEWMPDVLSYETDSTEPAVGTISTMRVKESGKEVDYTTEILEYEALQHLTVEVRGGSLGANPMRVRYDVRPSGDGTAMTYRSDWKASGVMLTLMVPLIRFMAGRNATQAMNRLGQVVTQAPT